MRYIMYAFYNYKRVFNLSLISITSRNTAVIIYLLHAADPVDWLRSMPKIHF